MPYASLICSANRAASPAVQSRVLPYRVSMRKRHHHCPAAHPRFQIERSCRCRISLRLSDEKGLLQAIQILGIEAELNPTMQ